MPLEDCDTDGNDEVADRVGVLHLGYQCYVHLLQHRQELAHRLVKHRLCRSLRHSEVVAIGAVKLRIKGGGGREREGKGVGVRGGDVGRRDGLVVKGRDLIKETAPVVGHDELRRAGLLEATGAEFDDDALLL